MSKTATFRYEVGANGIGVIDHARTMDQAKAIAQNYIEKENKPAYIFDRMARKTKPNLFQITKCNGAAHSNPLIDHCGVCMPNWGIVVMPLERKP